MNKLTLKLDSRKTASCCISLLIFVGLISLLLGPLHEAQAQFQPLTSGWFSATSFLSDLANNEEADAINWFQSNQGFAQPICLTLESCQSENIPDRSGISTVSFSRLPKKVTVTAYSSTPGQTDSTPFITANGAYVYDGLVACNFLPFGAKVRFPEIYGDKIFTVEDRMAKKNSHKIDIWMPTYNAAINFGAKQLAIEIIK